MVGERAGEQRAMRDREQGERVGVHGKKAEAADAIRMRGNQAQAEARYLPEEAHPDEQAEVPAHSMNWKSGRLT